MLLFCRMGTQWRTGIAGATGLDYNVLLRLMDEHEFAGADRRELLDDIQVLEAEAIATMMARK